MRSMKLEKPIFPASILVANNSEWKERAIQESIPEFMRFNIVESEVRNVI